MTLINEAKKIANDYFEADGATVSNDEINATINDIVFLVLENNIEVSDAETLAAVAIDEIYEPNKEPLTEKDFAALHEFYFPSEPLENRNYSVEEIRNAIRDEEWR